MRPTNKKPSQTSLIFHWRECLPLQWERTNSIFPNHQNQKNVFQYSTQIKLYDRSCKPDKQTWCLIHKWNSLFIFGTSADETRDAIHCKYTGWFHESSNSNASQRLEMALAEHIRVADNPNRHPSFIIHIWQNVLWPVLKTTLLTKTNWQNFLAS